MSRFYVGRSAYEAETAQELDFQSRAIKVPSQGGYLEAAWFVAPPGGVKEVRLPWFLPGTFYCLSVLLSKVKWPLKTREKGPFGGYNLYGCWVGPQIAFRLSPFLSPAGVTCCHSLAHCPLFLLSLFPWLLSLVPLGEPLTFWEPLSVQDMTSSVNVPPQLERLHKERLVANLLLLCWGQKKVDLGRGWSAHRLEKWRLRS